MAGGAIAERIGLRRTMLLALVIRTAGFACFLPGLRHPAAAVFALFLVSVGAALYLPANKAYLIHRVDDEQRPLLLSASGSALNAGIGLGPPAAAPFVLSASAGLLTAVTALFAAITVGHALLPKESLHGQAIGADQGQPAPRERALAGLAVLPFATTALSLYVFMFFKNDLEALARSPRAPPSSSATSGWRRESGPSRAEPQAARAIRRPNGPAARGGSGSRSPRSA